MGKSRYIFSQFPESSWKNPLTSLSKHVLRTNERVFKVLQMYADESYVQYPEQIYHNMIQNNETIFNPLVPDMITAANTSNQGQLSGNLTSPKKGESGVLEIKVRKLIDKIFDTKSIKFTEADNLGKETTAVGCQETVYKAKMLSPSAEDEKMDKSTDKESIAKVRKGFQKSHDRIKSLMKRDLVQINSISIKQLDDIEVELEIDTPCISPASSPEKQYSSIFGKNNSPRRFPSAPPSKGISALVSLALSREYLPTVDYSDPNLLKFLAKQLLSSIIYRKACMEQILNFFQNFLKDVQIIHGTIDNINFVVEYMPMANEPYVSGDLVKLRRDLIIKAQEMMDETKPLVKQAEKDVKVWDDCLEQFDAFVKKHGPSLSTENESTITLDELKLHEFRLKLICEDADCTVILNDGSRYTLLNLLTDFEWLVKHFVNFLVITEILKPLQCSKDK